MVAEYRSATDSQEIVRFIVSKVVHDLRIDE